jgi:tyrosyl-tRNA synthetase
VKFIELIESRKFLAQIAHPDELKTHLDEQPRWAYVGFDPTAESLHVGNLMPIMALRRWQQAGHNAVVLMGGATALIGDPSGKSELRQMLTEELIDERIPKLTKQFGRFLDTDPKRFKIVNNSDWFRSMGYLKLLREIGTDFTVNRMLAAECFKNRYEKGLSFLEFNYMILQSYDFLHLNRSLNVTVQMGGDDQWSNMIGGMDLIRRRERKQAFIVTNPLLTTSSGLKMGKTEKGAVWLDSKMTPPFELFQYFRNVEDDSIEKCLLYFTDLSTEEVTRLTLVKDQSINKAKVRLAYEITKLIHGETDAMECQKRAEELFTKGSTEDAPLISVSLSDLTISGQDVLLIDLLVVAKVFDTKGDVRRMIEQGGVSVGDQRVTNLKIAFPIDLLKSTGIVVKKGKKNFYKLIVF